MRFACGCTKLLCITFCKHVNEAEDLIRDVALQDEDATTKLKAIIFCKIVHESGIVYHDNGYHAPEVDAHREAHWNDEEVVLLKEKCKEETCFMYNEREASCARCVAAAQYAVLLSGQ